MQNRQRDEIERDILTTCNGGSSITKIMFHAYTTHAQSKAYLEQLMAKGFAHYDSISRQYFTTSKGRDYLSMQETMAELFPINTKRSAVKDRLISTFL